MPQSSRFLILVGALQGVLLWWLWHSQTTLQWPANQPMSMGALLWATLAIPAAIYLSENSGLAFARRLKLVLGVGVAYALLGIYAGWMELPLDAVERVTSLHWAPGRFGQIVTAAAFGFILLPLVAGRENRHWNYSRLFELAWRNALLCASVVGIAGLFWGVLFAGAMLMSSLGLGFIRELIQQPVFAIPVTGMVVGAAFAQGLARADMLVNLRRYWLALNAWLLPLLLGFGVMWLVALPFTGLDPLFSTRSASFILLWFSVLAVNFINCAWQDGREQSPYPRWLAELLRYCWLTLPFVVGVAGWALALRINQYGLTEDRIWAIFIWLLAAGYALGYALSLFPSLLARLMPRHPATWMASVGGTNIAVALLALFCLALLAGPVADPRRLAVNDQVARLAAGHTSPTEFDYHYLRWNADRWGLLALQKLGNSSGDVRSNDIAGRARQVLAENSRRGNNNEKKTAAVLTRAEASSRITILRAENSTDEIPDSLIDFLREPANEDSSERCLSPKNQCAVWMQDFNHDAAPEALILVNYTSGELPVTYLFQEEAGHWVVVARIPSRMTREQWAQVIRQGQIKMVTPEWSDILVNGGRLRVIQESRLPTKGAN